ncbi:(2Fe-2S)-binding protein [Parablautia muri]|uniref:Bacterioferritin-associated ferredoxin n=1 Tax=Parablautia muri TaxID=2320879 RepID=A0A9X5GUP9_9FIRM|nr:(2Fe-2S)-binding protein [Parablautia muri]NBJ95080.1 (2Fe-2S)-binding protein [Parablautia muri]
MDMEKTVCYCMNVTNGMIKTAIDAGAKTLEEVQEATGAGTVCGSCIDNIKHLIDEFAPEQKK